MAFLQDNRITSGFAAVEAKTKALRVTDCPRGLGFTLSATSGTIAAAAAAQGCFWAMRNSPSAATSVFIERMRFQYTTIAAYTTPITAGRRLSFFRGTGAATTGGTLLTPAYKDTSTTASQVSSGAGGDARMATTTTLGVSGITWEANPFREMALTHLGAAGANNEDVYDLDATSPIILLPGQILGLRNINAMDAAGTWQVSLDVDYSETYLWSSTTAD